MEFALEVRQLLLLVTGISWGLAYCLIIYRSIKDKTYGMPFIGLAFNISWEFLYAFIFVPAKPNLQTYVNIAWFLLDVIILCCYFIYGKKEWNQTRFQNWFIVYSLFVLCAVGAIMYCYEVDMGPSAITYSAFIMNVLLSALYIQMLIKRDSLSGQSFGIALFKCSGTASATLFLFQGFGAFLILLGVLCFVLDAVYLVMLYGYYRRMNLHFITRKSIS
jgi:hypothetical protein